MSKVFTCLFRKDTLTFSNHATAHAHAENVQVHFADPNKYINMLPLPFLNQISETLDSIPQSYVTDKSLVHDVVSLKSGPI